MRPDVAARLAGIDTRTARKKLVYDTGFAIAMAAEYLAEFQNKYGLSDREAFIAYGFGEGRISDLRATKFNGKAAKPRGKSYDRLSNQISRSKEYKS